MKAWASLAWLAWALATAGQAQSFPEFKFDRLAQGYRFTQGPAWSKDGGYLIFSDTSSDRLLKWTPGTEVEVFRKDAHGPAGNVFDAQGRLYTCETRARRVTRTDKSGKVEVIADAFDGKKLNAPLQIAVSRTGHVYFTDPAFGEQTDRRELDYHGVYHIPPKGPMALVAKFTNRPRGIAVSPNGRVLYVSNADDHTIRAWDLDNKGDASNERILVSKIQGAPAGLACDEKGILWLAAKNINAFSPDGKPLHTLEMKEVVAGLAWGEVDMKTLFLAARGEMFRARPQVP